MVRYSSTSSTSFGGGLRGAGEQSKDRTGCVPARKNNKRKHFPRERTDITLHDLDTHSRWGCSTRWSSVWCRSYCRSGSWAAVRTGNSSTVGRPRSSSGRSSGGGRPGQTRGGVPSATRSGPCWAWPRSRCTPTWRLGGCSRVHSGGGSSGHGHCSAAYARSPARWSRGRCPCGACFAGSRTVTASTSGCSRRRRSYVGRGCRGRHPSLGCRLGFSHTRCCSTRGASRSCGTSKGRLCYACFWGSANLRSTRATSNEGGSSSWTGHGADSRTTSWAGPPSSGRRGGDYGPTGLRSNTSYGCHPSRACRHRARAPSWGGSSWPARACIERTSAFGTTYARTGFLRCSDRGYVSHSDWASARCSCGSRGQSWA